MLKDELLNLRCRPPPLVFVSVIEQTIKRWNGRGWGGRQRFHYDSGQNPLKANLTEKKKSRVPTIVCGQSEIIHRRRQSNFNCKCSRKTLRLRNGQR
ncbi:hypothetical protein ALC62_02799 [Cyphomyrmex costatus]|uniref:Uncharacterized protein n=1 Tax=Cyphomyrmex costatus TaxID=456900 RepID=A0A151IMX5_9HYME|nr:hypothetical protein ALC62_02799 [Cyphomyrmex costatus]